MKKVIVDSWTKVPFIGMQIYKFDCPQKAFEYSGNEYLPYGYKIAFFSTDIKTLFLSDKELSK